MLFHPTISKFYQHTNWKSFRLVIPLNFFLAVGRNYLSIAITNISNAAALVSHNIICFGCFMTMSHNVNKKATPIVSPHPSPLSGFHQVCFTRNTLSNFFCSYQIIAKIMHFQSKINFFFRLIAGRFWFCCCVCMCFLGRDFSQFCHHETAVSSICAYIRSFLLDLSSNHVAWQNNSWPWFENYKLLLFSFSFQGN